MTANLQFEALKRQLPTIITPDCPRLTYCRRSWEDKKSIIHWGQRKLLMSEIQFLTQWGHLSQLVIYAGAAPGSHLPYLSQLFPSHRFILVDPTPFLISPTDQIELRNQYFDDAMAKSYSSQRCLFISDIRTADSRTMSEREHEEFIIKDNEAQIRWISLIKPARAMLKFRCPYPHVVSGQTRMLRGDLYFQIWSPPTSTETRLVVDSNPEIVDYDNTAYEEMLFHHNNVTRRAEFSQPVKGEGLDARYDSAGEVLILWEYLQKFPVTNGKSIPDIISEMSREISRAITPSKRTLMTPMKSPEQRRQFPHSNHQKFHNRS